MRPAPIPDEAIWDGGWGIAGPAVTAHLLQAQQEILAEEERDPAEGLVQAVRDHVASGLHAG